LPAKYAKRREKRELCFLHFASFAYFAGKKIFSGQILSGFNTLSSFAMYEFAVTPAVTQLRRPGVIISEVTPGSLAEELELSPNDRIVRVNGRVVRDYLDFRFQTAGETELTFQVKKTNGETVEIEFDREESEDLGLMFEQIVPRQCANECIFCFCKGNPEDARPSLFVRDEDIRLSFLYGNYTTLSSITEDEMERIVEQRLSPQYVSVHATDLKTRAYLLGVDEKRADISDKLKRLLDNGIELHAQVVLCPEINDGAILERTLHDLAAFYPQVVSTAVVPVALTRYNTDERLTRVTPAFCRRTITQVEKLQKEFRRELATTFAFLGDEIYIKGGVEIPSRRHYGNYPQIEDGVGMVRSFLTKFERAMRSAERGTGGIAERGMRSAESVSTAPGITKDARTNPMAITPTTPHSTLRIPHSGSGTILTGEMFAPVLRDQIDRFNSAAGTRLKVLAVPNTYFGGDVSVAGLLTGQDYRAIARRIEGDFVIIPKHTIKSDEPILLDGMSLEELKSVFDVPLYDLDTDGLINLLSSVAN
jgi:putative radical SAM enzyme (TIGR03279 family)